MGNRAARAGAPNTVNSSVRTREYLTVPEVERLMAAARKYSRYGHRDATMILIGFRHGLRASELCDLQWHQVELGAGRVHVRRAKSGSPSVHPLQGDEIRALRRLQREQGGSSHVLVRAWQPHDSEGVPRPVRPDRRLGQDAVPGASAHAQARLRLCTGECRPRYPFITGVSRPQEHPHGVLH